MADEEKTLEEKKSGFMDILARGAEGAVDGFARSNPILGGALQAMVNTDEYQARQLQSKAARAGYEEALMRSNEFTSQEAQDARTMARNVALQQGKEFLAGESSRELARQAQDQQNTEFVNNAKYREDAQKLEQEKRDEYRSDKAKKARETGYEATTANNELARDKARFAQQMIWRQAQNDYVGSVTQDYINYFAKDPQCSMDLPEITALANSPAVQTAIKAQYYLGKLMQIGQGDKDAFDEIDSELNQQGWDAYIDNGVLYLKMGKENPFPVTQESMHMTGQIISENMNKEQFAHDACSLQNSIGSADRMLTRKYTGNFAKVLGSYSDAKEMVDGVTHKATPEQQGWARLRQAYDDFGDSTLPLQARVDELAGCLDSMRLLGYSIQGIDPNDPSTIAGSSIVDSKTKRILSLQEFGELCRQNDVLGKDLDNRYNEMALQAVRANVKSAAQNIKETGKAAKGKGADWFGDGEKGGENGGEEDDDEVGELDRDTYDNFKFMYGKPFEKLSREDQWKLNKAHKEYEDDRKEVMRREGVTNIGSVSDNGLKTLENSWKILMDEIGLDSDVFYSPVNNLIRVRDNKSRKNQTELSEQKAKEAKTAQEDWENNYHGPYEDSGESFRAGFEAATKRRDAENTKKKNDKKIAENNETLSRRGRGE